MKKKLLYFMLICATSIYAANMDDVKNSINNLNKNSAKSQAKIDKLDEQTRQSLLEYRALISKLNTLKSYDKQLSGVIKSQKKEIKSILKQISSLDETKQSIYPLMEKMVVTFGEFIQKDMPFLPYERQKRAQRLKDLLDDSTVSLADKYRRILEAYKIEYDFSNNIETYSGDLDLNGENIKVDFLRIGRVGLYYLTLDGLNAGFYNKTSKSFQSLDEKYLKNIKQAVKIAKKLSAPNVLILPMTNPTRN